MVKSRCDRATELGFEIPVEFGGQVGDVGGRGIGALKSLPLPHAEPDLVLDLLRIAAIKDRPFAPGEIGRAMQFPPPTEHAGRPIDRIAGTEGDERAAVIARRGRKSVLPAMDLHSFEVEIPLHELRDEIPA